MKHSAKKKIVVVVGSGFSAGLTSGVKAPIGNRPMPVLSELSEALLTHMTEVIQKKPQDEIPFSSETIEAAISRLQKNKNLPEGARYDFEQLISLLSIETLFSSFDMLPRFKQQHHFESKSDILRCLIYFIPSLFAKHLSIDGKLRKNRNLFYSVKDSKLVQAFQGHIRNLVDTHDVTFISFNYDGLLEAFLDCDLGQNRREEPPVFRYFPEISHGVPMSMPEHVFDRKDMRNLSKFRHVPLVLKPHGSMHFYQLKEEIHRLSNVPSLVALHPRFDIGFDKTTMQRDIDEVTFWRYADSVPFIIPPVLNKDSYLLLDYSKTIICQVLQALSEAEVIISFGFSIPRSDLHISALFELAAETFKRKVPRKIGLIYKSGPKDQTLSNWTRTFGSENIEEINNNGLPTSSVEAIDRMWKKIWDMISQ
jgi:hypothetical protein